MIRTITQRELRNDSAAVLREVQEGQTLLVTRNGTPIAELRPLVARQFVARNAVIQKFADAPKLDTLAFRNDLDSVVDQSIDG